MVNGQVPQGMEIVPGAPAAPGDAGDGLLPGAEGRGGHRPGPAQRAAVARREQPAGGQLHAEQRGRPQVRQGDRREHRPPARDRPRRPRAVGAAHRGPHHDRRPHHRQLHAGRSAESLAHPAVGRAAGGAGLPRGADDRPDASAPTRSAPASSPRSSACCSSSSSCSSTTSCRA